VHVRTIHLHLQQTTRKPEADTLPPLGAGVEPAEQLAPVTVGTAVTLNSPAWALSKHLFKSLPLVAAQSNTAAPPVQETSALQLQEH